MVGKHVISGTGTSYSPGMSVVVCRVALLSNRNCSDVQFQGHRDITPGSGTREQGPEVDASVDSNSLYHTVIDSVTIW